MKKVSVLFLLALLGAGALAADAQTRKIGMARATRIASKRVPGKIKSKELEHEKGRWIYSFGIVTGKGKITEVNVDAYTGKVVGIEHENVKGEAAEERNEKNEKH